MRSTPKTRAWRRESARAALRRKRTTPEFPLSLPPRRSRRDVEIRNHSRWRAFSLFPRRSRRSRARPRPTTTAARRRAAAPAPPARRSARRRAAQQRRHGADRRRRPGHRNRACPRGTDPEELDAEPDAARRRADRQGCRRRRRARGARKRPAAQRHRTPAERDRQRGARHQRLGGPGRNQGRGDRRAEVRAARQGDVREGPQRAEELRHGGRARRCPRLGRAEQGQAQRLSSLVRHPRNSTH